jgi:hypothetical protein
MRTTMTTPDDERGGKASTISSLHQTTMTTMDDETRYVVTVEAAATDRREGGKEGLGDMVGFCG